MIDGLGTRRRWIPRVSWGGGCMSDGRDEDAESWSISLEWFGIGVEFWIWARGR
jgi:hypothetical protein